MLSLRMIRLLPFHASGMSQVACHIGKFYPQVGLDLRDQYFPKKESDFLKMPVHHLLYPSHYSKKLKS